MPVHAAITAAMSSSVTWSLTMRSPAGSSRSASIELALERRDLGVQQPRRLLEVALALRALGLHARGVELGLQVADAVERRALALPPRLQLAEAAPAPSPSVSRSVGEALLRCVVLLLLERELLELEPVDVAAQLVDLERRRVDLHAQPRRGLVDQVDRLVGQLAARDVAVAERCRGDERGIRDRDLVVRLVALLEPAQDRDGVLDRSARRRRPAGSGARARHPSR